jgi:hypothetical protein
MHPTNKHNKKPHNRRIGETLRFRSSRHFSQEKPLESGSKGGNFFCVPLFVRTRLAERLPIVIVANPTEGYGIFIENMLNAANNQSQQKAA